MKKIYLTLTALFLLIAACSPKPSASEYLDWLYESMPLPDSLTFSREYWQANVEKTLEVRRRMDWNVPEREFRHFVLPLRVNNETLDDFRTLYADTLCARVKGMSLSEAAIEINHWCHEQATYKPSDARTSSPMATMRNGLGRCGEESVLAVAALRAAGIPARQVYTPRWAHTDDNHAWVEVWVDGKWYFMGACEPEPKLNMAWFNAPVSRAMLLHTKVFGDYHGDEDVIQRTSAFTEINVIRGYVPARRTEVTIVDTDGKPVAGANVEFKIYNYAEFYTVARYTSDATGKSSLNTGCGDVFIWASKDGRFGFGKASGETAQVVLDHSFGERFSADIDIVPPVEDPIVAGASEEQIADNARRLVEEDAIRASHDHSNPDLEQFMLSRSRDVDAIVAELNAKDRCDVTLDVLQDLAQNALSLDHFVLCPRVANEFLLPYRTEILSSGIAERLSSVEDVIAWTRDSIRVVDGRNPQGLAIPPRSVWRSRISDKQSRGIFFVALCRTLGFPARIDEVTGKTQYRADAAWVDGAASPASGTGASPGAVSSWVDVNFGEAVETSVPCKGQASISYAPTIVKDPMYYRHFALAKLQDGTAQLLEFGSDADETPVASMSELTLDEGYYMMTSGSRMADGSVLAHLEFFPVVNGGKTDVPLVLRESQSNLAVIGSMDAEQLFLKDGAGEEQSILSREDGASGEHSATERSGSEQSILSATGRGYFILAVMGDKDEPTSHARIEMEAAAGDLNAWGRPVLILGPSRPVGLENAIYGSDPNSKVLKMLCTGCESKSTTLPVIAVCDSFGRIVYFSQGYNTSLASDLRRVVNITQ